VLGTVTERDIPQHLKERFEEEKEQDLSKKKEKQDAHLYITVNVSYSLWLNCSLAVRWKFSGPINF
jgi:hypothetical protein